MRDAYQEMTDKLIELVDDAGKWSPPWHSMNLDMPQNAKTKASYRGLNVMMCWLTAMSKGYSSQRWATYNQWNDMGGNVKKGEKGTQIVFFKTDERENKNGDKQKVVIAKISHVFNANQVEGNCAAEPEPPKSIGEGERINLIEEFIRCTGAKIEHGLSGACYIPSTDKIRMPKFELFHDPFHYYSVLFHELIHWTGAEHRINRNLSTKFKSDAYAMEELVAEMGAAFLAAEWRIANHTRDDHAAYLKGWLEIAKKDKMALFTAATQAAKAADFLENCWLISQHEAA